MVIVFETGKMENSPCNECTCRVNRDCQRLVCFTGKSMSCDRKTESMLVVGNVYVGVCCDRFLAPMAATIPMATSRPRDSPSRARLLLRQGTLKFAERQAIGAQLGQKSLNPYSSSSSTFVLTTIYSLWPPPLLP